MTEQHHDRFVHVRGAREHNLKNIDVDIPRDSLVVFTGVSGSGKSSLAFGTLYAEAQRRYLESVSPYARRLFHQMAVPEVDDIIGLPPAVALQQQRGSPTTRSSVGSVTTLSNLLRMLYSRAGDYPRNQPLLYAESFSPNTPEGACPECHGLGRVYTVTEQSMVPDDSLTIRERAVAAWPPAWHGQNLRDILVTLGYDVDRPWRDLPRKDRDWILFTDDQPTVPVYAGYTPEETRRALKKKEEPSYMGTFTSARRHVLHTFANTQSPLMKKRAARYMLSADCPLCHGKRLRRESLSVKFAGYDIAEISSLPLARLATVTRPYADGTTASKASAGHPEKAIVTQRIAYDLCARLEILLDLGLGYLLFLPSVYAPCPACHGARYNAKTLEITYNGKNIAEVLGMTVDAAWEFFAEEPHVHRALSVLREVGLGYIRLGQPATELSGGEAQRIKLATELQRIGRANTLYILDEPTTGLHPADVEKLMTQLEGLVDAGNTVIVVEHDMRVVAGSDWVIDIGPGAGEEGGHVVAAGPPADVAKSKESRTAVYLARYLAGE